MRAVGIASAGFLKVTTWFYRASAAVLVPLIVLLVSADVVLRYVFLAPLPWGNEITGYLLFLCFLTAIPYCTARDRHIRVSLFAELLPAWVQQCVRLVTGAAGMFVAGLILWQAGRDVPERYRFEDAAPISGLPLWPLSLVLALFAAITFLQFALEIATALARPATPEAEHRDP